MTKTETEILQTRYGLLQKCRTICQQVETRGNGFTAEERKTFDAMMSEVDKLGAKLPKYAGGNDGRSVEQLIADAQKISSGGIIENIGGEKRIGGGAILRGKDGQENRMMGAEDSFIDDRGLPDGMERADFQNSLGRMLLAKVTGKMEDLNSVEQRALAEGAMAGGGFLAPVQTSQEIWEATRVNMVTARAGTRFVQMNSKELDLVVQTADAVASWVSEGTTIPESTSMAFARLKLNQHKVAVIVNINKELILDSPNASQVIMDSINYAVAQKLDYSVLYGTGAAEQPTGLYYDPNVTGVTDLGGTQAFSFDNAIDGTYNIIAQNYPAVNGLSMIMSPGQKKKLDKSRGNDGDYLIGNLSSIPNSVNWGRCFVTQQISATQSDIFIGDFSSYLIGAGTNVEVLNTEYTADQWNKYQISFRAVLRADGGAIRPLWFYLFRNAIL